MNDKSSYWNEVYETKGQANVSWFQTNPEPSLEFIRRYPPDQSAAIIDTGASRLADGFQNLTVMDISFEAIAIVRNRIENNEGSIKADCF